MIHKSKNNHKVSRPNINQMYRGLDSIEDALNSDLIQNNLTHRVNKIKKELKERKKKNTLKIHINRALARDLENI